MKYVSVYVAGSAAVINTIHNSEEAMLVFVEGVLTGSSAPESVYVAELGTEFNVSLGGLDFEEIVPEVV